MSRSIIKELSILGLFLALSSVLIAQTSLLRERSCSVSSESGYELTQLLQRGQIYGYCMQMAISDDQVVATYFVKENSVQASPYDQLATRFRSSQRMLISSAGFAIQNYDRPLGLCVAEGRVCNYRVSREMDGLALIDEGKLYIYNLEESVNIASLGSGRLTDAAYKTRFLNWAKTTQASVFQAHLLAQNNRLLIQANGRLKPAFRKILTEVTNAEGKTFLFVFYIQQGAYLFDASESVFDHLQRKGFSVDYMINLDTGAHDVLQLNDEADTCFGQQISGFSNAFSSSNLLLFYRP